MVSRATGEEPYLLHPIPLNFIFAALVLGGEFCLSQRL